jgi:Uma2 family endonuclease
MNLTTRVRRPTWELTEALFPLQGDWTEQAYLKLPSNRLIEFTDGFLDFLPMPDDFHFYVQQFIFAAVEAFLKSRGKGTARYAPWKVRVREGAFREPDVCVLLDERDRRRGKSYWDGADFVAEVVSPKGEQRDYLEKREEYAAAGIPEYWVIDPRSRQVLILRLDGDRYTEYGPFGPGDVADCSVLPGFRIDLRECFESMNNAADHDAPPSVQD